MNQRYHVEREGCDDFHPVGECPAEPERENFREDLRIGVRRDRTVQGYDEGLGRHISGYRDRREHCKRHGIQPVG